MNRALSEFCSAYPTDLQMRWATEHLSVPASVFAKGATLCGFARARIDGQFFEFDHEHGSPGVVVPCGYRGERGIGWDSLDDLVFFHTKQPEQWAVRFGTLPVLGADEIEDARWNRTPILLHATPLSWLRAGGNGACILAWDRSVRLWLSDISTIVCDSVSLGHRLSEALRQAAPATPDIRIFQEAHSAAA